MEVTDAHRIGAAVAIVAAKRTRAESPIRQNIRLFWKSPHRHQGSENVFTLLMNFIASMTPSLMPRPLSLIPPKGESSSR